MCCFGILFLSASVLLYFVSVCECFCVNDGAEGCVYCCYTLLWEYEDFYSAGSPAAVAIQKTCHLSLKKDLHKLCVLGSTIKIK